MALLSNTQGTPEMVWSLIGVLQAHGGKVGKEELFEWINPPVHEKKDDARKAVLGCAKDLEFVSDNEGVISLNENCFSKTIEEFSDLVHHQMTKFPFDAPNALVLKAFAWVIVATERESGFGPLLDMAHKDFADNIHLTLSASTSSGGSSADRAFNDTKLPPWMRWTKFLGLGVYSPFQSGNKLYPYVVSRMQRELDKELNLPRGKEVPGEEVLNTLANRMPYIDGGAIFRKISELMKIPPPQNRLSMVLSTALRELHDQGYLELLMRGDAGSEHILSEDPVSTVSSFSAIKINGTPS